MIVVSDTSPLTYLMQVGEMLLLKTLFDEVIIPPAVLTELNEVAAHKAAMAEWLGQGWIKVLSPSAEGLQQILLFNLDRGETEALALALALEVDYIITDERQGAAAAAALHIPATGLLGVLLAAKNQGIISKVKPLLDNIISEGFFITKHFYQKILQQANERPT